MADATIVGIRPQGSAEAFIKRYEGLRDQLPGDADIRADAAAILDRDGLPGVREEAWKYTSLRALGETRFHEALTEAGDALPVPDLPALGALADWPRLVFVQGRLREDLCVLPGGLAPASFADNAVFGPLSRPGSERMVALNTMLAEDGAVIDVPAGHDAGKLLLISIGDELQGTPIAFHPRHSIVLGERARLTLVEVATGHGVYLHNPVTEIRVGEKASLVHVRLQDESTTAFAMSTVYADVAADAVYDSFTLTTGGRLARTEVHARLSGANGHVAINTAQLLRGNQHADFTTVVSHDAPGCASRQTVKNVLADHARGVFQGKIEVARAAQKTDGYQMNQALLLSPNAEIDCKPQLEIYADDVKCSHGATVGELDAEQLFYLVSRGIPKAEAQAMLVRAFLAEALDMVADEGARSMLDDVIERWWAQETA